jgi:hypothetical protein
MARMTDPNKVHIKLVWRDGDAEYYELSIAGALSKWRGFVSGAAIAHGHRWRELAAQCIRYRGCVDGPALAHEARQ